MFHRIGSDRYRNIVGGPHIGLLFRSVTFPHLDTRSRARCGDAMFAMKDDKPRNPPPKLDDLLERADDFARREPLQATVSAFGAGFLLNLLPLGAIAAAVVAIAFALVRPALLFLGFYKACDLCRSKLQPDSKS